MSKNEISVDYVITAEQLTWVEENLLNELVTFLEDKTGAIVEADGKKVLIGFQSEEKLNKRVIKTYIKRFLHKYELLDRLRVVSAGANEYLIHKRKNVDVTNL